MRTKAKRTLPSPTTDASAHEKLVRVRLRALEMPPIKDGIVIGTRAAIGAEAMARTLKLMTNETFERIPIRDEVIEEVIVRSSVLKKLGHERLLAFVHRRVQPIMSESELLLMEIEVELVIEDAV